MAGMEKGFWVEIFRAGTHTDSSGKTASFSEEDLDHIIAAHDATRALQPVPIRLGDHNQLKIAGGWVEGLRRQGDRLLAFFTDVPEPVMEAFRSKLYRRVSIGLRFGKELGGKTWARFMDHVAVLGAEIPAVKGLKDIQAYLASAEAIPGLHLYSDAKDSELAIFELALSERREGERKGKMGDQDRALERLEDRLEKFELKFSEEQEARRKAEQRAEDAEKAAKEAKDALEKQKLEFSEAAKSDSMAEIRDFCEAAVKAGSMQPAQRDMLLKDDKAFHFSEAGDAVLIPWSNVKNFAESKFEALKTGEKGRGAGNGEGGGGGDKPAAEQLKEKALEYQAANPTMDFVSCAKIIRRQNPDLVKLHDEELQRGGD